MCDGPIGHRYITMSILLAIVTPVRKLWWWSSRTGSLSDVGVVVEELVAWTSVDGDKAASVGAVAVVNNSRVEHY